MRPTIYDVAKRAGVSIATVSKIINGKGRISEKTKHKVLRVMEELDYQPSVVATALTGKLTYTIGLLIPDLSNPFFAEIARSVEKRGYELGFSVIMCSTENDDNRAEQYISILRQKNIDGLIVGTGVGSEKMFSQLVEKHIPVVLIARDLPDLAVDIVRVDDFVGGRLATNHLIELGHKRIAVIAENLKVMSSRDRVRGYKQALEEAGIPFHEELLKIGDYQIEDGYRKIRELFSMKDPPTAVFACNDLLAIGVIQGAKEMGINVPKDLSVVGFDNTLLAAISDPPLTTVAQPIEQMGKQVVDLLVQELMGEARAKQRIILRPNLIIRQSTSVFQP